MFKLPVNSPEVVEARISELKSNFHSVVKKLKLLEIFPAAEVQKLLKPQVLQDVLFEVEDYQRTKVLSPKQVKKSSLHKPSTRDFIVLRLLQYVYGVVVSELRSATTPFPAKNCNPKDFPPGDIPYVSSGPVIAYMEHPSPHYGECVFITGIANVGRVKYWNTPVVVDHALIMDPVEGVTHARFLYHSLKGREYEFARFRGGTAVPIIPSSVFSRQLVAIPEYEVQKQIAAKFDEITSELENLTVDIERSESVYKYFKHKLLDCSTTEQEREHRLSRVLTELESVCDELGLAKPTAAEQESLQDLVSSYRPEIGFDDVSDESALALLQYVHGRVFVPILQAAVKFPTPQVVSSECAPGPLPFVAGGNPTAWISYDNPHRGECVVVSHKGNAGYVTYWNEDVVVSGALGLEAKPGVSLAKFLYYAIGDIQQQMHAMASGTTMPLLPKSVISRQLISLPSVQVQKQIVAKLEHCENFIAGLKQKREALQKIYNYALDRTFSGTYGDN